MSTRWIHYKLESFSNDSPNESEEPSDFFTNYDWIPLVCLMFAQFGIGLGIQNVPFILASEYFPTAIRPLVRKKPESIKLHITRSMKEWYRSRGRVGLDCDIKFWNILCSMNMAYNSTEHNSNDRSSLMHTRLCSSPVFVVPLSVLWCGITSFSNGYETLKCFNQSNRILTICFLYRYTYPIIPLWP